jgi:hypothetical protein
MTYAEAIQRLRRRGELPLFAGEVWDAELNVALRDAAPEVLFPGAAIHDPQSAVAVLIGLRLWNDDFEGAHNLAQGLKTTTGSYWHGLCHRREGHRGRGLESNLGNARHWFRQVGSHPAYDAVYRSLGEALEQSGAGFRWATEARSLLQQRGGWDPIILTDWMEEVSRGALSPATQRLLEEMQWREIATVVDWCGQQALGE